LTYMDCMSPKRSIDWISELNETKGEVMPQSLSSLPGKATTHQTALHEYGMLYWISCQDTGYTMRRTYQMLDVSPLHTILLNPHHAVLFYNIMAKTWRKIPELSYLAEYILNSFFLKIDV